ncbi:uncharacterized protein [Clytia hemisphaerica]|uniref:uncharacterized protein n=1 Tax=Clytia hemisphaerica TaxID=252671 RepID=UPI0034D63C19
MLSAWFYYFFLAISLFHFDVLADTREKNESGASENKMADGQMDCGSLVNDIKLLKQLTQSTFKAKDIQRLIITSCGEDNYDEFDREFPFNVLETISRINLNLANKNTFGNSRTSWLDYVTFSKQKAQNVQDTISDFLLSHNFTIRYFCDDKTDLIRSDFTMKKLKNNETKLGSRDEFEIQDWVLTGDAAFTKWYLCVDNMCPAIKPLKKYYHEIEIDFLEIAKKGLSDFKILAGSDFDYKIPGIKIGLKIKYLKGSLIFLPEMLFGYLYESKAVLANWLNMLKTREHTKTILETIQKHFPYFTVYIPGSVNASNWKMTRPPKRFK